MRLTAPILTIALLLSGTSTAWADGTETLGPPSIDLAQGSGIAVGGVGLHAQPGTIEVTVPDDATVEQVLVYFETGHRPGDASREAHDDTIRLDGTEVTGQLIGGPTHFYGTVESATHRADVTELRLVVPGSNAVEVDGLDGDEVSDGAGLVVLYSQPGRVDELFLVDGNDIAFADFEAPRDTTVPQTFTFAPSTEDRVAELGLLTASVHDPAPEANPSGDQRNRPNAIEVTVGDVTTTVADPLGRAEPEWVTGSLQVAVPAVTTSLTVRYLSEWDDTGDLPASLVWLAATLVVPAPAEPAPAVPPTTTAAPAPVAVEAAQVEATTTTVPTEVLDASVRRELPRTGTAAGPAAATAIALVLAGAALVAIARRARPDDATVT